jgi:hypothetical protein
MPRPELTPKSWVFRKKHRRATVREWEESSTCAFTLHDDSQYNPLILASDDDVRELEVRCVDDGNEIRDSGHKKSFYLDAGFIVGACSGSQTTYVYAEWCSGNVHGRPISEQALNRMGVRP